MLDDIIAIVILAEVVAIVGGGAFSLGPVLKLCLAALAFLAPDPVLKPQGKRPSASGSAAALPRMVRSLVPPPGRTW